MASNTAEIFSQFNIDARAQTRVGLGLVILMMSINSILTLTNININQLITIGVATDY